MRPSPLATRPWTRSRRAGSDLRPGPTGTVQLPPRPASTARSARRARCEAGSSMADRSDGWPIVGAALHGDGALAGLGEHGEGVEDVGQPVHPAQPLHGGDRHHHGGDRAVLAPGDPAFHVAPDLGEAQIGSEIGQLGPATGRAGGDEAPGGRSANAQPTRPSRGSARGGTAASTSPGGMIEVMSLAECTAASARPSATAASTSVTKTPWPADLVQRRRATSPSVRTTSTSTVKVRVGRPQGPATRSVWRTPRASHGWPGGGSPWRL